MPTTYSCDLNTLMRASACYMDKCLARPDRNTLIIWARIKNLAALGGTDYSANVKQLFIDSAGFRQRAKDELEAIAVYLAIQNAINDGATGLTGSVSSLMTGAKCLGIDCVGFEDQHGIMSYLGCAITTQQKPD